MHFEWTIYISTDPKKESIVGFRAYNDSREKKTLFGSPNATVTKFRKILLGHYQYSDFERELEAANSKFYPPT